MAQPKRTKAASRRRDEKIFGKTNWLVLGIGLVAIIIGFVALAAGSITLAPILLVLGYCVLIPVGIMIGEEKKGDTQGG